MNKILQFGEAQKQAGVIAASAGNHAQAVAHAASLCGIHATIVMPKTAPLTKVQGTREFGAEIVLYGDGFDAALEKAVELQTRHGYTLIHAFDDVDVIAGQGTIGLELLHQVPDMDAVLVPVGGGGLIAGIPLAIKAQAPHVEMMAVEADNMPAMQNSVAAGRVSPTNTVKTIADGIAVAEVGHSTLPITQASVSDFLTVSEEEIAAAIMTLLEKEKTLAEGAGAVGFAALLNRHVQRLKGRKVVVIISGGNIDMSTLSRILERGMEKDGRLVNFKIITYDKAESIAALTSILARKAMIHWHMSTFLYKYDNSTNNSDVKSGLKLVIRQAVASAGSMMKIVHSCDLQPQTKWW